jgi:hypothetical protein
MHIWTDLVIREGVFLLVLFLLGSGPASFLSRRIDPVARLALAPALGMCVGTAVTLTLVQWEPVRSTYWVLYPCAAVSLAIAVWRLVRRRFELRLPLREAAQLVLIALAVLVPASSTLHHYHTVGPVAWNVYDAAGYVSEIDGQQTQSISEARRHAQPPWHNSPQAYYDVYALGYQNLDVSALEGSVSDIMSLGSTDTQSPFLIALLLVGGLGAFAAFRYATGSRSWAAVIAGGAFGGPFFLQLWADSSEAAICGLALVLPFAVAGWEVLREGRVADCVLLGLVSAGLLSVYPLFVPPLAIGALLFLAAMGIRQLRRRRPTRGEVVGVVWRLALVVALAAALSPVAFGRDVTYWRAVLSGGQSFAGLPAYDMTFGVLPGWLLQTRQFYLLPSLGSASLGVLIAAVLVPLLLLGVIVYGFRRRPGALVLAAFALVCVLLAEYVWIKNSCEYCVQRNLLPLGPMAVVMVAIGLFALWSEAGVLGRVIATVVAVAAAISVIGPLRDERTMVIDTAYFMSSSLRSVLSHLPRHNVPVQVEGFNETARAPGELVLTLALVNERTGNRASLALDSGDYFANAYIGPPHQPTLLRPDYRYVLTRFAGVQTGRRTLDISQGVALQQRTGALDVTPVGGLGAPLLWEDEPGYAWLQGPALPDPFRALVVGGTAGQPAWVHMTLAATEPVTIPRQPNVSYAQRGASIGVCMRATGSAPRRFVSLRAMFAAEYPPPPPVRYVLPLPSEGVRVTGLTVGTVPCRP